MHTCVNTGMLLNYLGTLYWIDSLWKMGHLWPILIKPLNNLAGGKCMLLSGLINEIKYYTWNQEQIKYIKGFNILIKQLKQCYMLLPKTNNPNSEK